MALDYALWQWLVGCSAGVGDGSIEVDFLSSQCGDYPERFDLGVDLSHRARRRFT